MSGVQYTYQHLSELLEVIHCIQFIIVKRHFQSKTACENRKSHGDLCFLLNNVASRHDAGYLNVLLGAWCTGCMLVEEYGYLNSLNMKNGETCSVGQEKPANSDLIFGFPAGITTPSAMLFGTHLIAGLLLFLANGEDLSNDPGSAFLFDPDLQTNSINPTDSNSANCLHASSNVDDMQSQDIVRRENSNSCPSKTRPQSIMTPLKPFKKAWDRWLENQGSTETPGSAMETSDSPCKNNKQRQTPFTCTGPEVRGRNPIQYVLNCEEG